MNFKRPASPEAFARLLNRRANARVKACFADRVEDTIEHRAAVLIRQQAERIKALEGESRF